jgi:hypothetical protein
MGLHQAFRFKHASPEEVRTFLRGLTHAAALEDRVELLIFSELPGEPSFTFDCELTSEGFQSERAGEYFPFLGLLVEGLTGHFGPVEIEDV